MNLYLNNLISRLQNFSEKLNKIEYLVDKNWIVSNNSSELISYRFTRDNRLIISENGDASEGTWEFLLPNTLYLKFGVEGTTYSNGFLLDHILVLKKQAHDANPFVLYDSNHFSDGNLNAYLEQNLRKYFTSINVEGQVFYVENTNDPYVIYPNKQILDSKFEPVNDSIINHKNKMVEVEDGKIKTISYNLLLDTDRGKITLLTSRENEINIDDQIATKEFIEGEFLLIINDNSEYKQIIIKNGLIIKVEKKFMTFITQESFFLVIIPIVFLMIILFALFRDLR